MKIPGGTLSTVNRIILCWVSTKCIVDLHRDNQKKMVFY